MYLPAVYSEDNPSTLRAFIRANPLGVLTTAIDIPSFPYLQSSHIPWILDAADGDDENPGVLRGHMARANPQAKAMMEHLRSQTANDDAGPTDAQPQTLSRDVLVLFNSPVQHYLPPDFYAETKPSTHKAVPTWNYAAVQVYGKAKIYFDTKSAATDAFLSKQIGDLSAFGEKQVMGRTDDEVWEVSHAPDRYIDIMKKAIIGIEIEISSMEGKWKMSQETSVGDRAGVIAGFKAVRTEVAAEMARTVEERGTLSDKKKQEKKERKV